MKSSSISTVSALKENTIITSKNKPTYFFDWQLHFRCEARNTIVFCKNEAENCFLVV